MSRFSVEAVFSAVDRMTGPVRRMESGLSRSLNKLDAQMRQVGKVGSKVTQTFHRAGLAMGAAGVAAGAAAMNIGKTGAEFEAAISAVGAVSLKSRDEIADLEAQALALGASTKFTATEVAQGMELMAKAGFENEEILSGIEGVLAAAAAEGAELAETSDTVAKTMKGMGLAASESGRVADVLALASARTNSSIGSLGESMKNVAPVARQFGIEFEDAVASVALLQDVGLDASEAGTATATMLTKLAKPSAALQKRMDKMGVSFKDAEGNMLPLSDVLGQLDKASKAAGGNMDVVAFMADLVGLRGQKAALNLKEMFASGKMSDLAGQLREAEGAAAKMAELKMDNTTGDLLKLEAAIDGVKIALFNTQSGPLRGIVQGMTAWVDKNKELMTSGLESFVNWISEHGEQLVTILGRLGRMVAVVYGIATAFKVWAFATTTLTKVMAMNPATAWAVALIALAGIVAAFWPEISAFFAAMGEGIAEVASALGEALAPAWNAIVEVVSVVWDAIKGFFRGYLEVLAGIAGLLYDLIVAPAMQALQPLFDWFGEKLAWVGEKAEAAFTALGEWGSWIADQWIPGFQILADVVGGIFSALWANITSAYDTYVGPMVDKIMGIVDKVRGVGRGVLGTREESEAPGAAPAHQVHSPQERGASLSSSEKFKGELTIRDETGRAELSSMPGSGISMPMSSGVF